MNGTYVIGGQRLPSCPTKKEAQQIVKNDPENSLNFGVLSTAIRNKNLIYFSSSNKKGESISVWENGSQFSIVLRADKIKWEMDNRTPIHERERIWPKIVQYLNHN